MKIKYLFFIATIVVTTAILYKSVTFKSNYRNLQSLVNIETLASGENNSGNNKKCETKHKQINIQMQDCMVNGTLQSKPYKYDYEYWCEGLGIEQCSKGYKYVYYSCNNGPINNDQDYTKKTYCFAN
jgi:hypothetical protein